MEEVEWQNALVEAGQHDFLARGRGVSHHAARVGLLGEEELVHVNLAVGESGTKC